MSLFGIEYGKGEIWFGLKVVVLALTITGRVLPPVLSAFRHTRVTSPGSLKDKPLFSSLVPMLVASLLDCPKN
jgi:hypothetical protein